MRIRLQMLTNYKNKLLDQGLVAHVCNPSYSGGGGRRSWSFGATLGKVNETLSQKQNIKQKG
jgi:hypothetical protein